MSTTFPHLLLKHAAERPDAPALREKEYGIWQTWSWSDTARTVRHMACGLASLGLQRGQNLALISDNRPHLYMGFVAAQALGAVPVPLYQDAVATEMTFVMQDAEITVAFAENQEQVDKLLEVRETVPSIRTIIYDDPRGLRNYNQPGLISVEQLLEQGAAWDKAHPQAWDAMVAAVKPADVSVILYTSGTTGKPKGVCQTHSSFIGAARGATEVDKLGPNDSIISYLPPAWVGDHLFSLAQWLVAGYTINCPESAATVSIDMREIGPTYYFAPPRVFEGMLTSISIRMEDAAPSKRWLYEKCMQLARRVGSDILDGKPVGLLDRIKYKLGDLMIYGPLRNAMGLSRIHVAYTAGAAIGPDLFRFFRSIGINLKQFYGQTETCAYVCLQRDRQVNLNTVGQAAPGIELKIFSHVKEAVCFGHERDKVCAFINIDFEAVGNWAERQNLPYAGYVDLASKAKVLELIADCVSQVNADLASEPGMAGTQVARFLVLHKELDPDDDELTRTRKVRRGFIAQKYGVLVDALYSDKKEQFIETQVKFEDGRTGSVSATLTIVDAKTHPAKA